MCSSAEKPHSRSALPVFRPFYRIGCLFPILGIVAPTVSVQAQEQALPPVNVTAPSRATPTLPPIDAARREIERTPGGANLIDAEQYQSGRAATLDDVLRFSPGVMVASRFGAEEARLSIRGSGLQRTFHLRGIQLLQDGVPLNLADGSADFQAIEPLSARYVEVFRGANALQFGSTTLGGAINFVSPSGFDAPPLAARLEAGSFGYRRGYAAVAGPGTGAAGGTDWFVSASHYGQDGFRRHARQDTQRLSANVGLQLTPSVETRFFLHAVNSDSELPGALTRAELRADARQASPQAVSRDEQRNFDLLRLSNTTSIRLTDGQRIETGLFYSFKSLHHPIFQVLGQNSHDVGVNAKFLSTRPWLGRGNRWTVGISALAGRLADDRFLNLAGERGARTADATQRATNVTLFAENQHDILPSTALVLGAQALHATRELDDRFLVNGDQSVDHTTRRLVPKIGVRHALAPDVQVYANWSGTVEPPSFGELAGGPNVTPVTAQRGSSVEVGTRGTVRSERVTTQWDVSIYRAALRNELLSLNDPDGNPLGTTNADRTIHQGVEAGMDMQLWKAWTLRAAYQLNHFRFDGDRANGNNRLAGVPRHVATAELLYTTEGGLYVGPTLRAMSSTFIDHANSLRAPGAGIVGMRVGTRRDRGVSWFIDARNLGDKRYVATTNVVADAGGTDGRHFYPGDERSVVAGIEWKH